MFLFTLVQSRTHVDTVQSVSQVIANSSHICSSHTMKVLGWHVTFVRRSSAAMVALRNMYVDMKVLSRMFAVTVQCVSVQQVNWNSISRNTRNISSFAAVCVVNFSDTKVMLKYTSVDVVMTSDSTMFNCQWMNTYWFVCVTWLSSDNHTYTWHCALTHSSSILCIYCCSILWFLRTDVIQWSLFCLLLWTSTGLHKSLKTTNWMIGSDCLC